MIYFTKVIKGGRGLAKALLNRAPSVALDWDIRQKSRFETTDSLGRHVGIITPRGQALRGHDVVVGEDGSFLKILAKEQVVLRVTFCKEHGSLFDLTRAAYHLGNRHVPIELQPTHLQIEPDHVLASMLEQMHLIVQEVHAPFEPELGAYALENKDTHQHGHGHDHGQGSQRHPSSEHSHGSDPHHDHKHSHE
jgi:urease accessory protein